MLVYKCMCSDYPMCNWTMHGREMSADVSLIALQVLRTIPDNIRARGVLFRR